MKFSITVDENVRMGDYLVLGDDGVLCVMKSPEDKRLKVARAETDAKQGETTRIALPDSWWSPDSRRAER